MQAGGGPTQAAGHDTAVHVPRHPEKELVVGWKGVNNSVGEEGFRMI